MIRNLVFFAYFDPFIETKIVSLCILSFDMSLLWFGDNAELLGLKLGISY